MLHSPAFREGFLLSRGVGEAPKGVVLLLHGLTSSPAEMEGLAKYLFERGYSCLVPQLSGHSGDEAQLKTVTTQCWLNDAMSAMEQALGLATSVPCFIVGQSLGALLSIYLGSRYAARLRAIVLLSTPFSFRSRCRELKLRVLSYLPERCLNFLGFVRKVSRPTNYLALPHETYPVHSLGASARLFKIRRLVAKSFGQITCPVLLIQDPNDHHLHPECNERMRAQMASTKVKKLLFPGGQHELLLGHHHLRIYQEIEAFLIEHG